MLRPHIGPVVVPVEIVLIEEFRNHSAQIIGRKAGRLRSAKIQFG
jgi:hypothetical protein